jgi:polysaccharide export outer membrane protein
LVAATSDANAQGHYLEDGAMVMVRNRPPQFIHVIGLVKRPNQFPLPSGRDLRVLDAIGLAGGRTMSIADKVYVIRNLSELPEPVVIKVSVRDAKKPDSRANIALAAGDVVSVEETPSTFVLDTMRRFVNVGVSARGLFY